MSDISLREYIESIIRERDKRFEEYQKETTKALQLQAAEYERRLAALNGEHSRIAAAQSTYVSYSTLTAIISVAVAIAALYLQHLR